MPTVFLSRGFAATTQLFSVHADRLVIFPHDVVMLIHVGWRTVRDSRANTRFHRFVCELQSRVVLYLMPRISVAGHLSWRAPPPPAATTAVITRLARLPDWPPIVGHLTNRRDRSCQSLLDRIFHRFVFSLSWKE